MQQLGQKKMITKPKRTPEQIKKDKIDKLKADITKLRQISPFSIKPEL